MLNKYDKLSCSLCHLNAKLFISALQNVKKKKNNNITTQLELIYSWQKQNISFSLPHFRILWLSCRFSRTDQREPDFISYRQHAAAGEPPKAQQWWHPKKISVRIRFSLHK